MEEIFSGKTLEDAIANGLKSLNITLDEADYEVIEEGKKGGFLGLGAKPYKVRVFKKLQDKTAENVIKEKVERTETVISNGEDSQRAVEFLTKLFIELKLEVEISATEEENLITITLKSEKSSSLIGYRGEILDSLQTLAGAIANKGRDTYRRVIVNCEGYREKREETLKALAIKLADKAITKGRKIKLEPMNPFERRIIHATLAEREDIITESEGKDPNRYIVIIPKNFNPRQGGYKKDNNRGYRNDRSRNGRGGNRNSEQKGKKSSGFGNVTFLGNSLKDENKD